MVLLVMIVKIGKLKHVMEVIVQMRNVQFGMKSVVRVIVLTPIVINGKIRMGNVSVSMDILNLPVGMVLDEQETVIGDTMIQPVTVPVQRPMISLSMQVVQPARLI